MKRFGTTRPTLFTTTYSHGEVVLVEVVFSNQRGTKKRPALVLSTDPYHSDRTEVVVAAITSNIAQTRFGDTPIDHWEQAGLRLPSIVTGVIQTLKSDLVDRSLGELDQSDLAQVERNLRDALGLNASFEST